MEDIIKLNSRSDENNYLKRLKKPDGSESKTYVIKVSNPYVRVGKTNDGKDFIDLSGGPMIVVGSELEEAKAVVESINFTTGYGYTISFK